MSAEHLLTELGVYAGTFLVGILSSLIPFVSIDLFLIGVALGIAGANLPSVVILAAAGQLVGKLPMYFAVRGLTSLPGKHRARVERIRAWVARWETSPHLILASSAVFGLPPFSIVATAAGAFAIRTRTFCTMVFAGRAVRFAVVIAIAAANA